MNCIYASHCSGCSQIEMKYEKQKEDKLESFQKLLLPEISLSQDDISFIGFPEAKLRDRVDLSLRRYGEKQVLGLFDKDRKEIVDLKTCPQMSDELLKWYQEFRQDLPPVDLASIRLRVSPEGLKGVWLDLPNVSVKELFEEKDWLERLFQKTSFIEIGQRRKRLFKKEDKWKLRDPESEAWFETYDLKQGSSIPIFINIGGFSQPGFKANKKLIERLGSFLKNKSIKSGIELCAGSGNLSFALASLGIEMTSTELDKNAIQNAEKTKKKLNENYPVHFSKLNAHKNSEKLNEILAGKDLIVVDPPRSGLKESLLTLKNSETRPNYFLYISCFPKSFKEDLIQLYEMGYVLQNVSLLDQFAYSEHYEVIALLEKK